MSKSYSRAAAVAIPIAIPARLPRQSRPCLPSARTCWWSQGIRQAPWAERSPPLLPERPHLLGVQGDASSALGGALPAFAAAVPVAHIEAGLRSFDPAMP